MVRTRTWITSNSPRYTDTDLDPYSARKGLLWSHIGWMLVKPRITPGRADVRDLSQNKVIQWQRRNYFILALVFGILVPWFIPGYFWGDWRGGLYISGFLRITAVHHVRTFPFIPLLIPDS